MGPLPATGDDVVFANPGGSSSNNDLSPNPTLRSVTVNSIGGSGSLSLTGNPVVLQGSGSITDNNTNHTGVDTLTNGVTLGGPTTFTMNAGVQGLSFNGAITGTGGLTLVNNGADDALVLGTANSYSGVTLISGTGRVQVNVNGAIPVGSALTVTGSVNFRASSTIGSLAGSGAVQLNGNTLTLGGDNTSTTFSGVISGTGGLTKTGAGTFTVSGANTYSGATTVSGGTLQAGATNSFAPRSAHTVSGANLDLNGFNQTIGSLSGAGSVTLGSATLTTGGDNTSTAFSGVISGSGGITKAGSGTFTLSNTNPYTGGTTINAGTLAVSSDENLGAFQGGLTFNGGTLRLLPRFAGRFSVDFVSGRLVILNAGGGTVDTNGTVGILDGVVSGPGGLTKVGDGTLILSGTNTYTGATTVNQGTLNVNSSLTSNTTVNAGGTLGGTDTITGNVITNAGGTLAPGNSIGTISVTGNYTHAAGATYLVDVNAAGQSDKLAVTGTATLNGGTVAVLPASGTYAPTTRYTILTATGGVLGTFANVTSSSAFLTPTLSYDPNDVFLTLARTLTPGGGVVTFGSVVTTGNAGAVARAVDSVAGTATGDLGTLVTALLNLSAGPAEDAFKRLSGEVHASSLGVAGLTTTALFGVLRDRLSLLRESGPGGGSPSANGWPLNALAAVPTPASDLVASANDAALALPGAPDGGTGAGWWLKGYGGTGGVNGDGTAAGIDYRFGGVTGGADMALTGDMLVGGSLGYTRTGVDVQGRRDSTDIDIWSLAGYGSWSLRPFYLDALLGYAYDQYQTSRRIEVDTFDRTARGSHGGHTLASGVETGYRGQTGALLWTPFVGLTYVRQSEGAFTEHGAGAANLDVQSATLDSLGASVGCRLGWRLRTAGGWGVTPEIGLRYTRELLERSAVVSAALVGAPSASFRVGGLKVSRDDVAPSVGVRVSFTDSVDAALTYAADMRGDRVSSLGSAVLRARW